jgi:hypothetical protein
MGFRSSMARKSRIECAGAICHIMSRDGGRATTLTIKQIAERLHLGTSHSTNATLHRWMKNNPPTPSAKRGRGKNENGVM